MSTGQTAVDAELIGPGGKIERFHQTQKKWLTRELTLDPATDHLQQDQRQTPNRPNP
jgi:hypothetical protein